MSTFKYPYRWCASVVNNFVEKYARGTYNMARLSGHPPGELRHMLTVILAEGNSLRWESIKALIKGLNQDDFYDYKTLTDGNRKILFKRLLSMSTYDVIDEKDGRIMLDSALQSDLDFKRT